ncbi:MAG: hypothetical protein M3Y87_09080 [Myxococcota bacterium]|nr:hypothetical protein [Myxococcota bacterium]
MFFRRSIGSAIACGFLFACSANVAESARDREIRELSREDRLQELVEGRAPTELEIELAGALEAELTADELDSIAAIDWGTADASSFGSPAMDRLLEVSAPIIDAHLSTFSHTGLVAAPLVSQECVDQVGPTVTAVGAALNRLRDEGILGATLAATCHAALVPGPGLTAVGLCAAGLAILSWGAFLDNAESISSAVDALGTLRASCDPSLCGGPGQACCATLPACDLTSGLSCDADLNVCRDDGPASAS